MLFTHWWPSCSRAAFYTVRRLTRDLRDDKLPVCHCSRNTRCYLNKQYNDFIRSFECALILARVSSAPLNSQALAGSYILNDSRDLLHFKRRPTAYCLACVIGVACIEVPSKIACTFLRRAVCSCRELLRQIWSRR
jgi:hypothetical protein